jgi:anthranilate phosphoribosyltransferase
MPPSRDILEKLLNRRNLAESEAEDLLLQLTDPTGAPAMAGAILAALRAKGVVADEVRGFARGMRRLARRPQIPTDLRAIDVVGTGGDASGSLNISTGTALLTAACGVPVLKHGNRSVSSRAGSADVLEALGLKIPLDEREAADCLAASNFTFLFAPHYHPAMKTVAPVRSALGVRTIFNILGPLTNPAAPPLHLIGAFSIEIARLLAETLSGMELERTFVVHGAEGWDEPTPIGPFTVFDVRPGSVDMQIRLPADYGLQTCTAEALAGGDAQHNARALEAVLTGRDRGPHRDCLLLGTALALEVAGRVRSAQEGVELASSAIDSGKASNVLQSIVSFSKGLSAVAAVGAPAAGATGPAPVTAATPAAGPAPTTGPAAAAAPTAGPPP